MAQAAVGFVHANIDHIASYYVVVCQVAGPGAVVAIGWIKRHHIIRWHRRMRDGD